MEFILGIIIGIVGCLLIGIPILNRSAKIAISKEKTKSYMVGFKDGTKLYKTSDLIRYRDTK